MIKLILCWMTSFSLLGMAGCSMLARPVVPENAIPSKRQLALPHFSQTDRQCGPAALAMVLASLGERITVADLEPLLFTPGREGTLPTDIITGGRRYGKLVYPLDGKIEALLHEISSGNPPIVLVNLGLSWLPMYHYIVVTGYDLEAQEIEYTSGRDVRETVSMYTFKAMWDRADHWAAVVLNPGALPATAQPVSYMQAAVALENTGRTDAARNAYQAAHRRWPQDFRFPFLLGNTFLNEKKYSSATFWYEMSLRQQQDARVLNNLAWSLYYAGKEDKARAAIEQALQIDRGACGKECENTYLEITGK